MKHLYKILVALICIVGINANAQTYINETYTTGTASNDYIENVTLGPINNTSGASTAPFYNFYSNLSATLAAGNTYTINLTSGNYSSNVYAA